MLHAFAETGAALDLYRQALDMACEIGYRRGEAFVLTHMAYALAGERDPSTGARTRLAEAEAAFRRALAIRTEISPDSGLPMDDLAGLSRVALLASDAPAALAYAEEVLAWVDAHGTAGLELPGLAYLICYQALYAAGDGRAEAILQKGRDYVLQSARSADDAQRRMFLEQVPWNRDLLSGVSFPD